MQGVGPGSLLGGRYLVRRRLAQGTRYERWSAADQMLDRVVVLLCFDASGPIASAALDAARRAAGVEERRLVRVLDVGRDASVAFVVEEPLTGAVPLATVLTDGGLSADEARRLVGEAASALDSARARGLHHGVLTPRSVLLLDDGAVKVRGLATEAVLADADDASSEQASRADTVALVALAYALLTGRWPLPGPDSGLEAAPRVVGGVAPPSEVAAGVPADLDLMARTTLNEDGGPATPGELADQLRPWSPTPLAGALLERRVPGNRTEPLLRDPVTRAVTPRGASAPRAAPPGVATGAVATAGGAAAGAAGTGAIGAGTRAAVGTTIGMGLGAAAGGRRLLTALTSAMSGRRGGARPGEKTDGHPDGRPDEQTGRRSDTAGQQPGTSDGRTPTGDERTGTADEVPGEPGTARHAYQPSADGSSPAGRPAALAGSVAAGAAAGTAAVTKGLGSAIGAAGGIASSVGGRVGGVARGAADRAAERSASRAERRQTERFEDPLEFGEEVRLSDTLEQTDERLEPVLSLLPGSAQEPLDREQSRLVLAVLLLFVIVAAALGIWGLPKLGGLTVSSSPAPAATRTTSAPNAGATPAPPPPATPAPPVTQPVAIVGGRQLDLEGGGLQAARNAPLAWDGNPETMWRSSKWFGTAGFGGFKKQGLGLVLDLGQPVDVHAVSVSLRGVADVTVYVATQPTIAGQTAIGTISGKDGESTVSVANGGAVKGSFVIVWFTTLAPDGEGHFRAQVGEVKVT